MGKLSTLCVLSILIIGMVPAGEAQLDIDNLSMQRKKVIQNLIALIGNREKQKNDQELVGKAIVLLGDYRAVEAVSSLIDLLDYDCASMRWTTVDKMKFSTDKKHIPVYFSVASLVKIGNHSVLPLLALLKSVTPASSGTDFIRPRLALQVLLALLGRDRLVSILKDESASNSEQKAKDNWAHSIKTLEEMGDDPALEKLAPAISRIDQYQK